MSKRKWKKWTEKEISKLIMYWESGITIKEIQGVFSKTRSAGSVAVKINQLQKEGKIMYRQKSKQPKSLQKKFKHNVWNDPYKTKWTKTPPWVEAGKKAMMGQQMSEKRVATSMSSLIRAKCFDVGKLLEEKNAQYGDSALNPIRVFSKADATEQLKVRIDDKLSRLVRGNDSIESDEDVIKDLIGYLILLLIQYDTQAQAGENA